MIGRSRVRTPLSLREHKRKGAWLPYRLMWRICSCSKRGCVCQRAYREPYRECFDCWYDYHYYEKPKNEQIMCPKCDKSRASNSKVRVPFL